MSCKREGWGGFLFGLIFESVRGIQTIKFLYHEPLCLLFVIFDWMFLTCADSEGEDEHED